MAEKKQMNLAEKLFYIQQNLKAPKGQYNEFGNYKYRSCEDIQEAVKPLLKEVKAILLLNDEIIQLGDRFYIRAVVKIQDTETGEEISNTAYARECESKSKMDLAQITGSCSSYARKYALNGLFCIDDNKDLDELPPEKPQGQQSKPQGKQTRQQTKPKLQPEYQEKIRQEAQRTGTELKKVCERYNVKSIEDMTYEDYMRASVAFRKMPDLPPPADNEQMSLFTGMDMYNSEMPFR